MNNDLENVRKWCKVNKLSLNSSKSNYIIVPPKLNLPSPQFSLILENNPISHCKATKHLGVFIDPQLNFSSHIKNLENKISRSVGILSKLSTSFHPQPYLNYIMLSFTHICYILYPFGVPPLNLPCRNYARSKTRL